MQTSGAGHKFPWYWHLGDLERVEKNGRQVFSCFSCGGGSSMGYKLAGYDVVGNCEIDRKIFDMYCRNLHPAHPYCMDLRDFNKIGDFNYKEMPPDIWGIDVLDGSPPCTTFSTVGRREQTWGKAKAFREGQKMQTLDDLFFVFLETVRKIYPKVVIAENVVGITLKNAKGYVNQILHKFQDLGYQAQIFRLNSARMGVPQKRERVFFIANRLKLPKLQLSFDEPPITFGEVRTEKGVEIGKETLTYQRLQKMQDGDYDVGMIAAREEGRTYNGRKDRGPGYTIMINRDDRVAFCQTATVRSVRAYDKMRMSDGDIVNVSTFPQDYDFCGNDALYVCGMSVPPVMMAQIASEVYRQWLT